MLPHPFRVGSLSERRRRVLHMKLANSSVCSFVGPVPTTQSAGLAVVRRNSSKKLLVVLIHGCDLAVASRDLAACNSAARTPVQYVRGPAAMAAAASASS